MTDDSPLTQSERLFTYDFKVLLLAATFGFGNIAIFYGFETYLARLGIDPAWRGWLLGAEPLAAFCLRPFLSVLVTPRNALPLVRASLVGMGLALCAYQFARGIGPILAVRLFHGVSFVFLVSAVTVLLAQTIPKALAGRAFGYFSLSSLVPYALMPPLAEWLLSRLGREDRVYAVCSILVLPALALLAPLGKRLKRQAKAGLAGAGRPTVSDVLQTLALPPIRLVLLANLCLFMSTTLIFFFIKPFAMGLGLADPGLFFTVSTGASMAVRVLAGRHFDRLPKETVLVGALVCLAACMVGFAATTGQTRLLVLAGAYGLCLGVALPLMSAVMFGYSPPAMRGTNLNLMLFMMDTAYVFGPIAGGAILAGGAGYPTLFFTSCAFAAGAGLLVVPLVAASRRQARPAAG
jgi:MFS family permease